MADLPSSIPANDSKTGDGRKCGSVGRWFKRKRENLFKPNLVKPSTPAAQAASTSHQKQPPDIQETAKEILEVASRFLRTLIRNPNFIDTNPVKAVPAAVKLIFDIYAVSRRLHISVICLLLYQAIGDNKDKIKYLEETVKNLQALDKTLNSNARKAAEQAFEDFAQYVILRAPISR
jgi:hypothetical protein